MFCKSMDNATPKLKIGVVTKACSSTNLSVMNFIYNNRKYISNKLKLVAIPNITKFLCCKTFPNFYWEVNTSTCICLFMKSFLFFNMPIATPQVNNEFIISHRNGRVKLKTKITFIAVKAIDLRHLIH